MKRNNRTGKIGVFDSGLGGLVILKVLQAKLQKYDYEYYGDTKNLPYGDKSQREIFDLTIKGIEYLEKQGCILIIIACNTASAKALRKIQQQWIPKNSPNLKVLGVIVPTIEYLQKSDFPAALLATTSTVKSGVYDTELKRLFPKVKLISIATPKLVPLIEQGKLSEAVECAKIALDPVISKKKSLILGCTHYPLIASEIKKAFPKLNIIDQTEIIPAALENYLARHRIIQHELSQGRKVNIHFTKDSAINKKIARTKF